MNYLEQTKLCPRCKNQLALFKFAKNRCTKDGLQVYCRNCLKKAKLKGKLRKPPATKKCARCQETFPSSEFWRNKALRDGLQPYCKSCNKVKHAEYRDRHKDQLALSNWLWREDNRERYLEKARIRYARYRERNREVLRLRSNLYKQRKKQELFRQLLVGRQRVLA